MIIKSVPTIWYFSSPFLNIRYSAMAMNKGFIAQMTVITPTLTLAMAANHIVRNAMF